MGWQGATCLPESRWPCSGHWRRVGHGKNRKEGRSSDGILNDMSGPYSDLGGPGSLTAAKMAVEDAGGRINGVRIDVISGDHQNKTDIGSATARRWFDTEGLTSSPTSRSRRSLAVGRSWPASETPHPDAGSTSDLSGKACSPYSTAWQDDTYAYSKAASQSTVANGGKTWFFIAADYAFGHALERDVSAFIKEAGRTVLGTVRHPINTNDMSSYLLQAQNSKAQVIGFLNGGSDLVNSIKRANEFGIADAGASWSVSRCI